MRFMSIVLATTVATIFLCQWQLPRSLAAETNIAHGEKESTGSNFQLLPFAGTKPIVVETVNYSPRRLNVAVSIHGVDDEVFKDEVSDFKDSRQIVLANTHPQDIMPIVMRWGGECRVEVRLIGQMQENGRIMVRGKATLYEGVSEDSTDKDGEIEITDLVLKSKALSTAYSVSNENEGGDYAEIDLTYFNSPMEDD